MKIVHIAPNSPYNDYWGYQDNLLPKYHKKLGHDVTVILSTMTHKDGKIATVAEDDYMLNDGVRIIRLNYKRCPGKFLTRHNAHLEVYEYLMSIVPDFIFFHGLVSKTIYEAVKYKKKINENCVIVQDNHLDYNIGWGTKNLAYYVNRTFYRRFYKHTSKYISKIYGVTPWRKKYSEDFFGVPENKTDVLIMGADDEKIDFDHRDEIRATIRRNYAIADDDFLIVTGGKIDLKKKTDVLMKAINPADQVKLLIFGSVSDEIKETFQDIQSKNNNIIYIGWIDAEKVYDYFFAADLVFLPGQHSVLWEQACASKVPCVFEKWEGMEHVNNGGNSDFIAPVTVENLKRKIEELHYTPKYFMMKSIAESEATDIYLYSRIAEKSLECAVNESSSD